MKGGLPGLATSSHYPRFATGHRFVIVSLYFAAMLSDANNTMYEKLEMLVSEINCYISSGMLNSA